MTMSTYPVGTQILKLPVTIVIPAANTPFNPDAVNPPIVATFNGVKALEAYGLFKSDFDKAQPPYPTSSSTYVNSGAYYISGSVVLAGASTVAFASPTARTYSRGPKGIFAVTLSATDWLFPTTVGLFDGKYKQGTDVVTGSPILWIMNVPPNSSITGASVWVDPPAGHGGVLPTNPPKINLHVYNPSAGTIQTVAGAATFDPTLIADYETPHQFSTAALSGATAEVGDGEIVIMEVRGEYGGSAVAGCGVYAPEVTFTRTKLGEE